MADMINELLGAATTALAAEALTFRASNDNSADNAAERLKEPLRFSESVYATVSMTNIDKFYLSSVIGPIGNLTTKNVEGLMTQLAKNATNFDTDRYTRVSYNAVGKYGLTIRSLESAKLLRAGVTARLADGALADSLLNNPGNWDGRGPRPDNLGEFISNQVVQEKTMISALVNEYNDLISNSGVTQADSIEIVGGMLAVAYIHGAKKAAGWRQGASINAVDQESILMNFDLGRYATAILGAN